MHARLRSTFVYVTHDQNEALALADRIALMARGRILQCDTPRNVYECPASAETARFLGGSMLLPAQVITPATGCSARVRVAGTEWQVRAPRDHPAVSATLSVRAHDLALAPAAQADVLTATVLDARYQGSHWLVRVRMQDVPAIELEIAHRGEPPGRGESVGLHILDGWVLPDRPHM